MAQHCKNRKTNTDKNYSICFHNISIGHTIKIMAIADGRCNKFSCFGNFTFKNAKIIAHLFLCYLMPLTHIPVILLIITLFTTKLLFHNCTHNFSFFPFTMKIQFEVKKVWNKTKRNVKMNLVGIQCDGVRLVIDFWTFVSVVYVMIQLSIPLHVHC